jgi:hypothetical protein
LSLSVETDQIHDAYSDHIRIEFQGFGIGNVPSVRLIYDDAFTVHNSVARNNFRIFRVLEHHICCKLGLQGSGEAQAAMDVLSEASSCGKESTLS